MNNKRENGQVFLPMKNLLNIISDVENAVDDDDDETKTTKNKKKEENNGGSSVAKKKRIANCGLSSNCYSRFLPVAGLITVMLGLTTFFGISLGVVNDNQIGYYRGNGGSYIPPGVYFQMPWHTGKLEVTDIFNKSFVVEKLDLERINASIRYVNIVYDIRDPMTYVRKIQMYDMESLFVDALRDTFARALKSDIGSKLFDYNIQYVCKNNITCHIKTTIFLDKFGIEMHDLSFNMYDVYKLKNDDDS